VLLLERPGFVDVQKDEELFATGLGNDTNRGYETYSVKWKGGNMFGNSWLGLPTVYSTSYCRHCTAHHVTHTVQHIMLHTLYSTSCNTHCTAHHVTDTVQHIMLQTLYSTSCYTHCTAHHVTDTVQHIMLHTPYTI